MTILNNYASGEDARLFTLELTCPVARHLNRSHYGRP